MLKLVNEQTSRNAFVGIGFVDRSDSFDLNVALQDYFKYFNCTFSLFYLLMAQFSPNRVLQMEQDTTGQDADSNAPKLDLGFKEGQTIKVNLNIGVR